LDQSAWDLVQARLGAIRQSPAVTKARATEFWTRRRARHLLTGLVEHAMSASAIASASLAAEPTMKHVVIVSQVRSITVDLLRAIGVDREQASARLQAAAGVRLGG
jgi:hypothetical protein